MRSALILALALLAGPAHAQPPDAGSDEAGLGMQLARVEDDIRTSSALVRDPALNAMVRGVACKLADDGCSGLHIYIVGTPGLGVIALPNGAMVVWTGTLLRAENEAQLAQLLGHELAHYRNKDSLGQFHRMLATSGVVALLGLAASGIGAGFVGTPASMAALSARYAHSQSEERAADRDGFAAAIAASYDPQAIVIWRIADAEYEKIHPGREDRLAGLQALADAAPKSATWKTGADSYRAATSAFQERWVNDELRRGDSVALFTRLSASGRGIFRYGLGESYRKRGLPGDAALAQAAFRAALSAVDPPPLAWRGLGLVALQDGDKGAARNAFLQYRTMAPDADDKAMIDYYLVQR